MAAAYTPQLPRFLATEVNEESLGRWLLFQFTARSLFPSLGPQT